MTIKLGDIVRTPPGAVYGDALAIVTGIREGEYETAITIRSQRAELVYEPESLTVVATIEIVRHYAVCRIEPQGMELHVCVGDEMHVGDVRKLAFIELLKQEDQLDAEH